MSNHPNERLFKINKYCFPSALALSFSLLMLDTMLNISTAIFTYVADLSIQQSIRNGNCAPATEEYAMHDYDMLCNENFSAFLTQAISNIIIASAALACIPFIVRASQQRFFGERNFIESNNACRSIFDGAKEFAASLLLNLALLIIDIINIQTSKEFSNLSNTINDNKVLSCGNAFADELALQPLCDLNPWIHFSKSAHFGLAAAGTIVFGATFLASAANILNHMQNEPEHAFRRRPGATSTV